MTTTYTHFSDVGQQAQPPDKGILSRTLHNDDRLKVVLFGFAPGEELSEHTASMPAILHFLQGEGSCISSRRSRSSRLSRSPASVAKSFSSSRRAHSLLPFRSGRRRRRAG